MLPAPTLRLDSSTHIPLTHRLVSPFTMPTSTRMPSVPFPDDIPTAPLRVIDYASLLAHDPVESKKLYQCAVDLGFFYLENHGLDYEPLKDIMEEVFELPEEEKANYDVALTDTTFGWSVAPLLAPNLRSYPTLQEG